ncbi:hypothetical protein BGZ46_004080, partial [Entomortierella lignicola]
MFLLLVSFTALSVLPYFPMYMLGLPFHLLIFSIFNRLMSEWVWWCIGCYTVLTSAPSWALILAKIRISLGFGPSQLSQLQQQQHDARGESFGLRNKSAQIPPSPLLSSSYKYSPLRNIDNNDFDLDSESGNNTYNAKSTSVDFFSRLENIAQLFSISNRSSIRWRMLLALALWLSYVIPVTVNNEP